MISPGAGLVVWDTSTLASGLRLDPYQTFNFLVEIEGLIVMGFTDVSGLESSVETIDHREGGVNNYVHHFPGQVTQANLVLKRGMTFMNELWSWYYDITQGIIQRRNGTIMMLNHLRVPVMWWNFHNAFPTKWSGPQFDASNGSVAFESLDLVHQGLSSPTLF